MLENDAQEEMCCGRRELCLGNKKYFAIKVLASFSGCSLYHLCLCCLNQRCTKRNLPVSPRHAPAFMPKHWDFKEKGLFLQIFEQGKNEPDTCPPCLALAAAWAAPSTGRQLNVSSGLRKTSMFPIVSGSPQYKSPRYGT